MALSTIQLAIASGLQKFAAAVNGDTVALAHVNVGADGTEKGTVANPMSFSESGVQGVTGIATPGRGCVLVVTTAGNVDFTFADASTLLSIPVQPGHQFFPYSVTAVAASSSGGAVLAQVKGAK